MQLAQIKNFASDLGRLTLTSGVGTTAEFLVQAALHAPAVLRTGKLAVVDTAMGSGRSGASYSFRVKNTSVRIPARCFAGAREMYARQVYFAVPGFDLQPNDVVVDLGANAGLFTVLSALKAKRVVAVEAQSRFEAEARALLQQNGVLHKAAFECGLIGARAGVFVDQRLLHEASHFERQPPVLTFPELMEKHQLEHIDFLKCDIEGSEFDLFNAEATWLHKVDRIVAEVHSEFGDHGKLAELLVSFGFEITSLDSKLRPLQLPTRDEATYLFARANRPKA